MYYFTPETIVQANKQIANLDAKTGDLFCILHCLTENIEENISYTIIGIRILKSINEVDKEHHQLKNKKRCKSFI